MSLCKYIIRYIYTTETITETFIKITRFGFDSHAKSQPKNTKN